MKKLLLMTYIFIISTMAHGSKLEIQSKKNAYLGLKTGINLQEWDKTPTGFNSDQFSPPEATVLFGARKRGAQSLSDLEIQISVIDLQSQTFNFDLDIQLLLGDGGNLNILYGLDFFAPIFQGNSKFDQTQFDHFRVGAHVGLGINNDLLDFYFTLGAKQVFTSTLANFEAVETEIAHDMNYIYTIGIKGKLQRLRLMGEFALTDSRQTTILSKEFFYRVPSEKTGRFTGGMGYIHDDYNIWIKFNSILNVDDQSAHFYNLPYFSEDYQMSKDSLFVEYMWKY